MKKILALGVLSLALFAGATSVAAADMEEFKLDKHTKVVLDTDVGTDDAVAILTASYLPQAHVDYMVASKGNASLEGATRNAIILKKYLGMRTKIVQGKPPAADSNVNEAEKNTFHGNDGLANISSTMIKELGLSKKTLNNFMTYDKYSKKILRAKKIVYIAVGPTTNLAHSLDNPNFKQRISKIYIMGGGIHEFNCGHNTEFNFSKDPQSVKKILESGLDITLFPLDLTNYQRVQDYQIDKLEQTANCKYYIPMLKYNKKANLEYNKIDAAVLHDTMPVLYLAQPEKFTVQDMHISVDKYGATQLAPAGHKVHVALDVEKDLLNNTLTEIFSKK